MHLQIGFGPCSISNIYVYYRAGKNKIQILNHILQYISRGLKYVSATIKIFESIKVPFLQIGQHWLVAVHFWPSTNKTLKNCQKKRTWVCSNNYFPHKYLHIIVDEMSFSSKLIKNILKVAFTYLITLPPTTAILLLTLMQELFNPLNVPRGHSTTTWKETILTFFKTYLPTST